VFLQGYDDGEKRTHNRLNCAGVAQENSRKRAMCEHKIIRHVALVETLASPTFFMPRNGEERLAGA